MTYAEFLNNIVLTVFTFGLVFLAIIMAIILIRMVFWAME